jgi:hypothetical protein
MLKNSKEYDPRLAERLSMQDSFKLPNVDVMCREGTMLSSIVDPFLTELNEEEWEAQFDLDGKEQYLLHPGSGEDEK